MKRFAKWSILASAAVLLTALSTSCDETYWDEGFDGPEPAILVGCDTPAGSSMPTVRVDAAGGDFTVLYKVVNAVPGEWIDVTIDGGAASWLSLRECLSDRLEFRAGAYSGSAQREGIVLLNYPYAGPVRMRVIQGGDPAGTTPDPGTDPDPTPDGPDYGDTGSNGTYNSAWPELPVENRSDNNFYYAHHICPDFSIAGHLARNFTVCFSAEDHCVQWVAAPLHSCYVGDSGRTEAYQPDPQIPASIQYQQKNAGNSNYNRGHMLGSGDRTVTKATNNQVFYYSNIAPQNVDTFNNGGRAWNKLEDFISTKVCADTTYVVIGTYFKEFRDTYGTVASPSKITYAGRSDVSCPTMFYYAVLRTKSGNSGKSVLDCEASELMCAAFVLSHKVEANHSPQAADMMSIAELEAITGQTYFANVPAAAQLKGSFKASDWGL